MTQSQSSVIKSNSFIFFYRLKLVITNLGWMGRGKDASPNIFCQEALMLSSQVLQDTSQSSVIKFSSLFFTNMGWTVGEMRLPQHFRHGVH